MNGTRFLLPRHLGSADNPALFRLCAAIRHANDDIILDGTQLQFVDPFGIAVLGALLEPERPYEVGVQHLTDNVFSYLQRMDFFSRCRMAGVHADARRRLDSGALVELTCLSDPHEGDEAALRLARTVTGFMTTSKPDDPLDEMTCRNEFELFCEPLEYALTELLNNSLSHARLHGQGHASVWIAAQYYPARDLVRVAVVDNGCGMLRTLQSHQELTALTHQAAILAALKPRVSCNRDVGVIKGSVNAGVGLTTTFHIAKAAQGGLTIITGDGYHNTQGSTTTLRNGAFWDGVAIALLFRRTALRGIRPSEQLPRLDAPKVRVRFE